MAPIGDRSNKILDKSETEHAKLFKILGELARNDLLVNIFFNSLAPPKKKINK